uniref:Uncharacterized protein n=1 Tax=Anguilla anguilla TaxID=7936 RepID=A0A0E9PUD3_ANGAN
MYYRNMLQNLKRAIIDLSALMLSIVILFFILIMYLITMY